MCNWRDWWVFLVFRIRGFFFPNIFCCFFCCESWWGHCPWIVYVFMNLFFQCGLLCLFFVDFFSQPDVNITWITGHIHRSVVDKIDPTSEYVEMVKKYTLSITLGYIVLWNVIRRIYLTVRNTFDEPSRGPPPPFF